MIATRQPLLKLSEARIQEEVRRAAVAALDAAAYGRKIRRLVLICINDYVIGLVIIGFSLHMSGSDLAQVVFYLGVLRAFGVPWWTVITWVWLEENGGTWT